MTANRIKNAILVFCIILFIFSSCQSSFIPAISGNLEQDLKKVTDYYAAKDDRVGLGMLYYNKNKGSFYAFSGYTDITRTREINKNVLFEIASITKMFVAVVTMQLAEEGVLNTNDTLTKYGIDFSDADKITIMDLLRHSSGIPDYFSNPELLNNEEKLRHNWTSQELLDMAMSVPEDIEQDRYSNTNYVLLGMIIEQITGNRPEHEIRNRILKPLNMNHTFYRPAEELDGIVARGYNYIKKDAFWDAWDGINPSVYSYSGGMVSTVDDLRIFLEAIYNGTLLHSTTLFKWDKGSENFGNFGIGLFEVNVNDIRMFGHGGASFGTLSYCFFNPETKDIYIVFSTLFTDDLLLIGKNCLSVIELYNLEE